MNNPISQIKDGWSQMMDLARGAIHGLDQLATSVEKGLLGDAPPLQFAFSGANAPDLSAELSQPLHSTRRRPADGPASGAPSLETRRKALQEGFGVDAGALKALDAQGVDRLVALVTAGPATARLTVRILNAVHHSSPSREREALQRLAEYPGRLDILEDFLNQIGHDDPFVASARAQVLMLPVSELPPGVRIAEEGCEDAPAAKAGRVKERARGSSGHIVTGVIHCAYDKDSPHNSVGFFAKRQAVMRPFESFCPEKFGGERERETRQRRQAVQRELLGDVTLADLEQDPDLVREIGSPIIARDLTVYHELQRAIREYKEQLDTLVYGQDIVVSAIENYHVRTDSGGSFLGWFHRQIEEERPMPAGIRIAYESLVDASIHLEPEQERDYIRGLLAYQRLHSYVSKDTALAGMRSDLEEYDRLPEGDPHRLNAHVEEAKRSLQEIAAGGESEMRVSEFGAVLSLSGLTEFRRSMNGSLLERYSQDFYRALEHFRDLMQSGGRWREDCLQESVPMTRLRLSLYGAKIGVEDQYKSHEQKLALLTQKDFRAIKDALFYQMVTGSDAERLLCSLPIARFKELVERVVVAYRKAAVLDRELEAHLTERRAKPLPDLQIDRADVGEALSAWKPVLPLGNGYKPAEAFMEAERSSGKAVLPLSQVVGCAKARKLGGQELRQKMPQLERESGAGLYDSAMEETLTTIHALAERFTPAEPGRC
jgi:hypothetical protein